MRKRFNSESENSVTQIIVEEDSNLYKDKAIPATSITTKLFQTFYKTENSSAAPAASNSHLASQSSSNNLAFEEPLFDSAEQDIFVMTARDRTVEFSNTIRSLQGRNINRVVNLKDPKKVKQMQSYSEFMMIAKNIGRNIASTYTKLEKLTLREYIYTAMNHKMTRLTLLLNIQFQLQRERAYLTIDQPRYRNWRTSSRAI